jgi:two-component system chemotaxis response regulator CheB
MPQIALVVIGTSLGGVKALCTIVKSLPKSLDAAVLIVMHVGAKSELPSVLRKCGTLPCEFVVDHPKLNPGNMYIAPPGFHMRVENGHVGLFHGEKENHSRPSVNPLFRSAAQLYGSNVVGVILTGLLSDGALGLAEVKRHGGIAIVQDPEDADHPSMPIHALKRTEVDYCLPLEAIGPRITALVGGKSSA